MAESERSWRSFRWAQVFQLYLVSGEGKVFDVDLVTLIADAVNIPVIASSGFGAAEHFSEVFKKTNASAALAIGIFHRKEVQLI